MCTLLLSYSSEHLHQYEVTHVNLFFHGILVGCYPFGVGLTGSMAIMVPILAIGN